MTPKVCVLQPLYGQVPVEAAMSFTRMLVDGSIKGLIGGVRQTTYALLGEARNMLVREALVTDCSHFLFVDSDVVLPHRVLGKLLSHRQRVVSALYFERTPPFSPVAYRNTTFSPDVDPNLRPILDYPSGLSEVAAVGMGCVLVEREVFVEIAKRHGDSWFQFEQKTGEDVVFCRRCAEASIPIHLDADLKCGHVASVVISETHHKRKQAGDLFHL